MSRLRNTIKMGRGKAWIGAGALSVATLALAGCHTDMWAQPKYKSMYASDFFADQQASRPLVPGTIPQGVTKLDDPAYFQGRIPRTSGGPSGAPLNNGGGNQGAEGTTPGNSAGANANLKEAAVGSRNTQETGYVRGIPVRAVRAFVSPREMLLRGKDRYTVFCSPCHGRSGDGNGFIMQRGLGYWQQLAASYHIDRLRKADDGHIYNVITNGYGVMYGYQARIQDVNDRWAVVAYVRALQLAYVQSGGKVGYDNFAAPLIRPGEAPETTQAIPSNTTRTKDQVELPQSLNPDGVSTPSPMLNRPSNAYRNTLPGSNPAPKPNATPSPRLPKAGISPGTYTAPGNATSGAPRNVTDGAGEGNR